MSNFTMENLETYRFSKAIKINITSMEIQQHLPPQTELLRTVPYHFLLFLPKMYNLKLITKSITPTQTEGNSTEEVARALQKCQGHGEKKKKKKRPRKCLSRRLGAWEKSVQCVALAGTSSRNLVKFKEVCKLVNHSVI